jgi:hypothetical protein
MKIVGVTFIHGEEVKFYDPMKKYNCKSIYTKMFLSVKDESSGREDD